MSWVAVAVGVSSLGSAYLGHEASQDAARHQERGADAGIAETARQFDVVQGLQRPYTVTGTSAMNTLAKLYGLDYAPYQDPDSAGAGAGAVSNWRADKGQRYSHRNVRKMLRHGSSVDDILETGYLGGRLNAQRVKKLKKLGVTDEEISRLMAGPAAEKAAAGDDRPDIVSPDGPDMSLFTESPDYQINLREGSEAIDRTAAARSGALSGNAVGAGIEHASDLASGEFSNFFNRLATIAGIGQSSANTTSAAASDKGRVTSDLLTRVGDARASGVMGSANSVAGALDSGLSNWLLERGGYFDGP